MKNAAYVDGSYNTITKTCGAGVILYDQYGNHLKFTNSTEEEGFASMRNVGGEILAAEAAIKVALGLSMKFLTIYHDYAGIEKWVTGEWQAKNNYTLGYRNVVFDAMKNGLQIRFEKVKAHSGDKLNDEADKLAKEACSVIA